MTTHTGPVAHLSQLHWKPGATADEIERVGAGLATLPGRLPGLLYYAFGSDLGLREVITPILESRSAAQFAVSWPS